MSRCFPYPPPGFSGNGTRGVAAIESIKREERKAQKVRREEKVKKERRKEKTRGNEEKKRTRRNGEIGHQMDGHKKRRKDDMSQEDQKRWNHLNGRKNETDLNEKSSLTEEHGHSLGSVNVCYSSDGSLNSNKRQKYSSPSDSRHNSGKIFRIRLPLRRHKDPEPALDRTDALVQEMHTPAPKPIMREEKQLCLASGITSQHRDHKPGKENPRHSTAAAEIFGQKPEIAPASISSSGSNSSLLEPRLMDLLEYWVPPLMLSQWPCSDNQDWLLETNAKHKVALERRETNQNGVSHGNSASWSRVFFLPEVDIYALPFTVPF